MSKRIPAFYGITRIDVDQKRGAVHAYRVSIRKRNKKYIKYFTDVGCGSKLKALVEAKKYRDEVVAKTRPFTRAELSMSIKTKNKSGMVGVTLIDKIDKRGDKSHKYSYWKAWWSPRVGVRKVMMFSINKYGYEKALQLAKKARLKGLKEMDEYDLSYLKLSKNRLSKNMY